MNTLVFSEDELFEVLQAGDRVNNIKYKYRCITGGCPDEVNTFETKPVKNVYYLKRHVQTHHSNTLLAGQLDRAEIRYKIARGKLSEAAGLGLFPDLYTYPNPAPRNQASSQLSSSNSFTSVSSMSVLSQSQSSVGLEGLAYSNGRLVIPNFAIAECITFYVASSCASFRSLENDWLQIMFKKAGLDRVIDRKSFANTIMKKVHNDMKATLKKFIQSNAKCISLSTDGWEGRNKQHYLSVTIYFMDMSLKPRRILLGFPPIDDLSSEGYFKVIKLVLLEWNLSFQDINIFISDGASNMQLLGRLMKAENPHIIWLWCTAHKLQLCLKEAFSENKEIEAFIDRIMNVTKIIRRTRKLSKYFHDIQERSDLTALNLKYKIITRWRVLYEALERVYMRFHAVKETFDQYASLKPKDKAVIEELEFVRQPGSDYDDTSDTLGRYHLSSAPNNVASISEYDEVKLGNILEVLAPYYDATVQLQKDVGDWPFQLSGAVSIMQKCVYLLELTHNKFNSGDQAAVSNRKEEIKFCKSMMKQAKILLIHLYSNPLVMDCILLDSRFSNPMEPNPAANRLVRRQLIDCTFSDDGVPFIRSFREMSLKDVPSPYTVEIPLSIAKKRPKRRKTAAASSKKKGRRVINDDDDEEEEVKAPIIEVPAATVDEDGDLSEEDEGNVYLVDEVKEISDDQQETDPWGALIVTATPPIRINETLENVNDLSQGSKSGNEASDRLIGSPAKPTQQEEKECELINFDLTLMKTRDIIVPRLAFHNDDDDNDDNVMKIDHKTFQEMRRISTDDFTVNQKKIKKGTGSIERRLKEFQFVLYRLAQSNNASPIEYWKENLSGCPYSLGYIVALAAIPCTTCLNERIFAIAGNILKPNRFSLLPTHFEMQIMINVNLSVFECTQKDEE